MRKRKINLNKVDWDKLKILRAMAEGGKYKEAAKHLGMTSANVSKHIIALEEALGLKLINRHKGRLAGILSENGKILNDGVDEILRVLSDVEYKLNLEVGEPVGELVINTTQGLGTYWLAPRLVDFYDKYPKIQIILKLKANAYTMLNEKADIFIGEKFVEDSFFEYEHIGSFGYGLFATQSYLDKYGTPKNPGDLDKHRTVDYISHENYPGSENPLLTIGRQKGSPRRPFTRVNDLQLLLSDLRNNVGIVFLMDYVVPNSKNIVRIPNLIEVKPLDFYLIYPKIYSKTKKISAFREYIFDSNKL